MSLFCSWMNAVGCMLYGDYNNNDDDDDDDDDDDGISEIGSIVFEAFQSPFPIFILKPQSPWARSGHCSIYKLQSPRGWRAEPYHTYLPPHRSAILTTARTWRCRATLLCPYEY